jgi:hypothetical protein
VVEKYDMIAISTGQTRNLTIIRPILPRFAHLSVVELVERGRRSKGGTR